MKLQRGLSRLCGGLAAVALFCIMMLTLVDVTGRKVLSESVPGSLELTELLMVLVIFASLPLVSLRGEHVVFDSLDHLLSARWQRLQQGLVNVICAAALGGLAWLMAVKGGNMLEYGDVTSQLKWPLGPFVYLMSFLCGVTALVHLGLIFNPEPAAHDHSGEGAL